MCCSQLLWRWYLGGGDEAAWETEEARLPYLCGDWPDTHPTVCVFSFVPGRLSVSWRLLFDLPVYTGLGLHYPQSRKPAFLPIVMSLNVCAFVASSEAPAGRAGPVPRTAPSSYGSSKMCNVTYQASPLNVRTTFTPGLHCGLGQIQGFVSLSLESQIFAICCSGSVKFWLLWNLKTVT